MYQTLPFVLEGQQNFVRFNASQRIRLFMALFEEEFDINVLMEAKVIISHVMCHTTNKTAIMESFQKYQWRLFVSLIVGESWVDYMEPICLIADYYGEKMALFMAFLMHHVG